jgi:euchromatic histone-lysine N-methyltransferase
MAGIDYMSVRISQDEEPIAVSIVSSGGYEDDVDGDDGLIYTGQGRKWIKSLKGVTLRWRRACTVVMTLE